MHSILITSQSDTMDSYPWLLEDRKVGVGEGGGVAQSEFELRTLSTVFYRLHTTLYFVVVVAFPTLAGSYWKMVG